MLNNIPIRPGAKNPNSQFSSGYRSSIMDAAKAKKEKERVSLLERLEGDLRELEHALQVQEDADNRLIRELATLNNKTQGSTTVASETVLNIQSLELKNKTAMAENDKKIRSLDQEVSKLEHEISEDKLEEEKLKRANQELAQSFEMKKQVAARASQESAVIKNKTDIQQRFIKEKTDAKQISTNRVVDLRQKIQMLKIRIKPSQK